jgi:transcriptional regulator GlxA family with amidase domain
MSKSTRSGPVRVSLVALPESTPAALYGLFEVLSLTGITWPQVTGEGEPVALFDVRIVSTDGKPFDCAMGTPIAPHAAIGDVQRTDILIAADLALTPDMDLRTRWPEMTGWIREQFEKGATVCSVCTGTALLAGTGLLDNQEATTHWSACGLLQAGFPDIDLKPNRIIVPAGADHRIITSGGASSWEDLALYLIGRFHGQQEAVRTAKIFLFGDRSEGQLPFAAMGQSNGHADAVIADCQVWVAMHYGEANPVALMVGRSGLAERTFKRRFKAATGYAPMDYVQTLRIEEAKQMLETGDEATDVIAQALGYEDPTYFRRLFRKRTGTTPGRYRQRFRSLASIGAEEPGG